MFRHRSFATASVIMLVLGFVASCGDAGSSSKVPPRDAPTSKPVVKDDRPLVIFLGDSLSAGLHLAADEAFPAVLQRRLSEDGKAFRLVNAGTSGDTTAGGARRIDWLLSQKPKVIVVELGANDGLRGVAVADVEKNLRTIIERARTAGARVLLLGVPLPDNYGAEYVTAFRAIFPRLAKEYDVPLVENFLAGVAGRVELNLEDGIHPNIEGHEKIADNVEAALSALL